MWKRYNKNNNDNGNDDDDNDNDNNVRSEGLSEDKISILQMILDELAKEYLQKPFNLRNVERSRLKKVVREVNEVFPSRKSSTRKRRG